MADLASQFYARSRLRLAAGAITLTAVVLVVMSAGWGEHWLYEDVNWLPASPLTTFRGIPNLVSWILHTLGDLRALTPNDVRLVSLVGHLLTTLGVGLVARTLWTPRHGWIAAWIFGCHPLAYATLAYPSAVREVAVGLGAVALTAVLLRLRSTRLIVLGGIVVAGVVVAATKPSAVGLLGLPMLILWRRQRRASLIYMGAVAAIGVARLLMENPLENFVAGPYGIWLPRQMAAGLTLLSQSVLPIGIAFQREWFRPDAADLPILITGVALFAAALVTGRSDRRWACLWTLCVMAPRLFVPVREWEDRFPELLYTAQWYPALPGLVWVITDALVGSASAPSVAQAGHHPAHMTIPIHRIRILLIALFAWLASGGVDAALRFWR